MSQAKGKRQILIKTQEEEREHLFYPTLRQCGTDVVIVNCGPNWDLDVIKQDISQGPHRSALDT